jgi:hypothetical protein
MLVLGSGPMIKRLFTTSVLIFGRTSSSASTLNDSLPVCRIERVPIPLSSTSSKPLTFLVSLVTLPASFVVPMVSSVPPEEDVTYEDVEDEDVEDEDVEDEDVEDEDVEDEDVEEEMLPFL